MKNIQRFISVAVFLFLAAAPALPVQAPAFEVASIKLNVSGQRGQALPPPKGGRFTATNVSFHDLIGYAYRLQDFQLAGLNGWMNSDRYDVVAKAANNAPDSEIRVMVQALLADRFHMKSHRADKEMPLYELVIARNGLKMPKSAKECGEVQDPVMPCGGFRLRNRSQLMGRRVPIEELIEMLSLLTGRYIANKTGLTGNYDIELQWSPDETLAFGTEANTQPDEGRSSLFTALQSQLGLKLQASKGVVPILVIDHAEKL